MILQILVSHSLHSLCCAKTVLRKTNDKNCSVVLTVARLELELVEQLNGRDQEGNSLSRSCLGSSEDITTSLSRQQWFSVVDRNSSFARKGEAVDIRKLACELGVRYVLEGSVRKAGSRIRITTQLVDATKRIHVWADRHDTAVSDIFIRQDEITNRIVDSVRSQLVMAEAMRLRGRRSVDVDAHDLVTQALPHMWRMSVSEQQLAQTLLQQAAAREAPQRCAHVHALLGWTYMNMFKQARPRWRWMSRTIGDTSCLGSVTRASAAPTMR